MKRAFLLLGLPMAASCSTVANTLAGAPAEIAPVLPEAPEAWAAAGVEGDAPPTGDWLSQFDDPTMVSLVDEALAGNPSLAASEARVRAARETARSVFGRSLPSVDYSFSNGYATQFTSTALGGGVVVDGRFDQPNYDQRLTFSWELDLWGRVRAQNRAARQDFVASEADFAAARLSVGGQAANAWIDLNAALEQERVAQETYEANRRIVELTERRLERGLSTALDVRTARTQLAVAEAQIAAQAQARENAARRLEVLLGRYPNAEIEAPSELPDLDGLTPIDNPTLLLARRPDIAAAEARLEAAGYRAEQARLAILPAFRATATISNSSSIEFGDIFDPERLSANVLSAMTQTVWNGGALRADKRGAAATAEAVAADYTGAVLTAWREVEDAIAADRYLAEQEAAQMRALEEARLAEDLAFRQYQGGLITIFNLLNSQTQRLSAESSLVQAKSARANNRVSYHLALGGGALLAEPAENAALPEESTSS